MHTEQTVRFDRLGTSSKAAEVGRVCLLDRFRVSLGSKAIEDKGWSLRRVVGLVKLLSYLVHKSLVAPESCNLRRKRIAGYPYRTEKRGNGRRGG